ncbi:GntR family transcriptional regulator [Streptomyces sp. NPDC001634]|uniref:GntR family transcriptional regulator n=1 Tax=Streptomyces sp. NPDC001634 TaxID=3154390 RepID=UPI003323CE0A
MTPPYQRTTADLRRQILSGRLKPGEHLPPVRGLQQPYAIAGATAQAALRVLPAEGLIGIVHGRGSFVAGPLPQEGGGSARCRPPDGTPSRNNRTEQRRALGTASYAPCPSPGCAVKRAEDARRADSGRAGPGRIRRDHR